MENLQLIKIIFIILGFQTPKQTHSRGVMVQQEAKCKKATIEN